MVCCTSRLTVFFLSNILKECPIAKNIYLKKTPMIGRFRFKKTTVFKDTTQ